MVSSRGGWNYTIFKAPSNPKTFCDLWRSVPTPSHNSPAFSCSRLLRHFLASMATNRADRYSGEQRSHHTPSTKKGAQTAPGGSEPNARPRASACSPQAPSPPEATRSNPPAHPPHPRPLPAPKAPAAADPTEQREAVPVGYERPAGSAAARNPLPSTSAAAV